MTTDTRKITCCLVTTLIVFCLFSLVPAEKYKVCVVDGRGGFKRSGRYCPILDKAECKVECILGIDRLDCLRKISKGKADFSVFTPEDLVIASNSEIEILITNELRYTKEKYEYEVVAIVRDSSRIRSKHDLKDKRFCHPGYGYETDWSRILSNYLEASVIPPSCQSQLTITENRIKASSEFFKSACKAGPWVNNLKLDRELKLKYPNLCQLCNSPSRCDTEDQYWGRRGSLFCLTDGAGDVSWARLDDVQLHFGLTPGGPESSPDGYSFLCPDGSTRPLNGSNPCVWVVKPWPVIATKRSAAQNIQSFIETLSNADSYSWQTALLNLIETFHLSFHKLDPVEPIETYLSRATGFLSANSFSGCHPPRTIRICTTSILENAKCAWLRESATVYGVEPDLDCLKADNTTHCMHAVNHNAADVVMVPSDLLYSAVEQYNLKPLFYETVEDSDKYLTVGVTRNGTAMKKLSDLRGVKACFPVYGGIAWTTVVRTLHAQNLLASCSYEEGTVDFFGSVCVPGWVNQSSCNGVLYGGDFGALQCLLDGTGDVTFVSRNSIINFVNNPIENKFGKATIDNFHVLCENKSDGCQLSWAPVGQAMIRSNNSDLSVKDTLDVFLQLDKLFGRYYKSLTTPLLLFGPYNGKANVLFHDNTVRFRNVPTARNIDDMKRPYFDFVDHSKECASCAALQKSLFFGLSCLFTLILH